MKKVLLLAGIAGMVAANAQAFDVTPYVGLDATYGMIDSDTGSYVSSKNWSGAPVIGVRTDHYGLEAAYDHGLRQHKEGQSSRLSKYTIDALAFQQLGCSGRWEGVASAGVTFNHFDGHGWYESDHGYGERLGAGLQYALSENLAARAMYHYNWIHQSFVNNANEISLGLRYSF